MAGRAASKAKPKPRPKPKAAAKRSAIVADATSDRIEALFAALVDQPNDAATALVLADALQEQNDVRAELIVVQQAIAAAPKDQRDQLRTREAALVHATRTRLVGAELAPQPGITLDVRHGFVRRLALSSLSVDQLARVLTSALRSPDGRLLDTLELASDDEDVIGIGELFHALAGDVKAPPSLRRLKIGNAFDTSADDRVGTHDVDPEYDDEPPIEDLRGVLAMFPRLRELELDLGIVPAMIGPLASKLLEQFTWISPRLRADELAPLADSVLPALQRFELWPGAVYEQAIDDEDDEEPIDDDDAPLRVADAIGLRSLRPIFTMLDRSPALRELAIGNYANSIGKLVTELRRHELVRRLEQLELLNLVIDDEDADELVDLSRAVPALRFDFSNVEVSERVRASLERRLGAKLEHARWAHATPRFRFVAERFE